MSQLKQFKLPDVGEGLTEADIVKWLVQPGDKISINQCPSAHTGPQHALESVRSHAAKTNQ